VPESPRGGAKSLSLYNPTERRTQALPEAQESRGCVSPFCGCKREWRNPPDCASTQSGGLCHFVCPSVPETGGTPVLLFGAMPPPREMPARAGTRS
jgi:hypothetical protein